jgi:hypothetical protein
MCIVFEKPKGVIPIIILPVESWTVLNILSTKQLFKDSFKTFQDSTATLTSSIELERVIHTVQKVLYLPVFPKTCLYSI